VVDPGEEVRFASDSPLEGDGFELSVPRVIYRPAPAARALWAAAAGRPCKLWRYLFDDAVGQQQQ
jgi:hypothetical protein